MISITVHNLTIITHKLYRGFADVDLHGADGSVVHVSLDDPAQLRELAREASAAASELGAAMAEEAIA